MSNMIRRLSGQEWQDWADQLLSRRYGPAQYQKIPASLGDAGIEGFSLCGHAYQAYGVEEPVTSKARYEKQRDKMTEDVGKFQDNQAKLISLFGTTKIKRWCLLVPFFDTKDLVSHATTKTAEVVSKGLPYVASDFRVMICDEDEFAVERDALLNARAGTLDITAPGATAANIEEWAEEHDVLVQTLDSKVGLLQTLRTPEKRREFRDRVLKHFLEGQNILDSLRKYPEKYEQIGQVKAQRENFLVTECMVATGSAGEILQGALKAIHQAVKAGVCGLSDHTAEAMSWEAVADWLLRCPLDFPAEVPTP